MVALVCGLSAAGCTTLPPRAVLPAVTVGDPEFRRTMEAYAAAPIDRGIASTCS
jgi:hypothetical protein